MGEKAGAMPSDQVVQEVSSLERAKDMGRLDDAEKMADTDYANVLVQLISTSKELSPLDCAVSELPSVGDAQLTAPVASSDRCLIPPKSLKRACPTVVYRRRKQQLVVKEFAVPTTIKLAEHLRYNFSRSLSLEETGPSEPVEADRVFKYLRRQPVDSGDKYLVDPCEEPSSAPKQSK